MAEVLTRFQWQWQLPSMLYYIKMYAYIFFQTSPWTHHQPFLPDTFHGRNPDKQILIQKTITTSKNLRINMLLCLCSFSLKVKPRLIACTVHRLIWESTQHLRFFSTNCYGESSNQLGSIKEWSKKCRRILYMDVEPKIGVFTPPQIIPFVHRVFHYFHHPFWGFPPIFGNIHILFLP